MQLFRRIHSTIDFVAIHCDQGEMVCRLDVAAFGSSGQDSTVVVDSTRITNTSMSAENSPLGRSRNVSI